MTVIKNGNAVSSIPLNTALTVITLLINAISFLAWTTTNSSINRIEEQTSKHFYTIENNFVRLVEYHEFRSRIDARLDKIESWMKDAATRDEVNTRLGINSNSILQVRAELDTVKRDFGQTYNMRDVVKELQEQVKILQNKPLSKPP